MTPEQLGELRDSLPPFAGLGLEPATLRDYCRFYGIDFTSRFPGAHHRIGTVDCGQCKLAVQRWLLPAASANLLLVHGYFDHSGLYGKLIEFGLAHNCNVLIFDLPGHGLSSGERGLIDDFAIYGRAIAAALDGADLPAGPLWAMAQSTGCAALVEYARQFPWPFAATVMLAPLLRPRGWGLGRVTHVLMKPFTDSIKRKFAVNSSDPGFLEFVQRDPLQSKHLPLSWVAALKRWMKGLPIADLGVGPALVVQGDADQTVDWRFNTDAYCKLFPGSAMEIIAGAGHQLANESEALRHAYYALVAGYVRAAGIALPSYGSLAAKASPANAAANPT